MPWKIHMVLWSDWYTRDGDEYHVQMYFNQGLYMWLASSKSPRLFVSAIWPQQLDLGTWGAKLMCHVTTTITLLWLTMHFVPLAWVPLATIGQDSGCREPGESAPLSKLLHRGEARLLYELVIGEHTGCLAVCQDIDEGLSGMEGIRGAHWDCGWTTQIFNPLPTVQNCLTILLVNDLGLILAGTF